MRHEKLVNSNERLQNQFEFEAGREFDTLTIFIHVLKIIHNTLQLVLLLEASRSRSVD